MSLSVIIPTRNAGPGFADTLAALRAQTVAPDEILIVDSSSSDGTADVAAAAGAIVTVIDPADFGHGRTRNAAAAQATGDIVVFMTQDVTPADTYALAGLIAPIERGDAAATYGRQLPRPDASPPEQFLRSFNYPASAARRTLADLPQLGVRTFFMSNAAAAVRRDLFQAVEGFDQSTILCEDMILCAKLLRAGHAVTYAADARFLHSHDYTLAAQFRRYFDYGVFIATDSELLHHQSVSGKGAHFVRAQLAYLWANKAKRWIPRTLIEASLKFVAYQLGKRHAFLPRRICRFLSMHKAYWQMG